MNVSRTITAVFSYSEIVAALQAAYPTSLHVQGLPQVAGTGVVVETTAGWGLVLKYTTTVSKDEPVPGQKLLTGPVGV